MLQNNALLSQLKQDIRAKTPHVEGVIRATSKSFGFLETDDGNSYFVPPPAMKQVLHGDRVEAALHEETHPQSGEKREQAEPEKLIEASLDRFIGRVTLQNGRLAVTPDHPQINQPLKARQARAVESETFNEGDWVVAKLLRHPLRPNDKGFFIEVTRLIARNDDHKAPWSVVLARHDLPEAQPEIEAEWQLQDPAGLERQDLTQIPFFTIDNPSTRDMDDALSIEARPEGGWTLTVAIADPSAYVMPGSEADLEAKARAFTLYLPARDITMLPVTLSDDLCSLKQDEKRPALVCTLNVNAEGALEADPTFQAAWICSQARLNYDDVSDWLEDKANDWAPNETMATQLKALSEMMQQRLSWRQTHTLVFKDRPDYRFKLDDDHKVIGIEIEERRLANRMVEESMLLANVAAADFLARHAGQGVFSTHNGVAPEKLEAAVEMLKAEGLTHDAEQLASLTGFRDARHALEAHPDGDWLEARFRRFQGPAGLSPTLAPHFGLGFEGYATWTSPIRKYGDLVNHRLIKAVLSETDKPAVDEALTESLSEGRVSNRRAERDVKDWLYARYLKPQEGQRFMGQIVAINRGGMRVQLADNGATVFIPGPEIHATRDELQCDQETGRVLIQGEVKYRLADQIQIELTEVNEDKRSLIGRPIS